MPSHCHARFDRHRLVSVRTCLRAVVHGAGLAANRPRAYPTRVEDAPVPPVQSRELCLLTGEGDASPSCAHRIVHWTRPLMVGMKTVGNARENPLTVSVTVFFGRERERKNRMGKRNRYYGISGTESISREHADYDRESITQNGKIHTTTSNI